MELGKSAALAAMAACAAAGAGAEAAGTKADIERDVEFLARYMPPQDGQVPREWLEEHSRLAEEARAGAPEKYPDEIFLDYVLPYSVIREGRDDWRGDFRRRFLPLVKDAKDNYAGAAEIDRKMWNMINVHYNTKRDMARQSPSHSMRIHMASCTGLSILLIDACRSVGIPARLVGCNWTTIDGNHSWVEVWSKGGWHVLASNEKEREDNVWFLEYASKADKSRPDKRIYASRWSFSPEGTRFWRTWSAPYAFSDVPADEITGDYLPGGRAAPKGECIPEQALR